MTAPIPVLELVRLSEVKPEPINWLWPGRIAKGKITFIAGLPGLGKSQVTVSIAAIVSSGGIWPVDEMPADVGNVLILSAEDGIADTIKPRLLAAGPIPTESRQSKRFARATSASRSVWSGTLSC